MDTSRILVYDRTDAPLFEIAPGEVYERKRTEELNGRHILSLTTTRRLQKGWRVLTVDAMGKWREYVVSRPDERHDDRQRSYGVYECEWSIQTDLLGVPCDATISTARDPRAALATVLEHTSRWGVGTIGVTGTATASVANMSAWEALGAVCAAFDAEVDAQIAVGTSGVVSRKVALASHLGATEAARRFDFARDMTKITRVESADPYFARIRPLGRGEERYDAEGGVSGYGRRVTIESVNGGVDWLQDDAVAEAVRLPDGSGGWEYPTVTVINQDADTPAKLKAWGLKVITEYTRPKVTYQASVAQLEEAGMDAHGLALGDEVVCVDRTFGGDGLRISGRVTALVVDETDPRSGTKVTIGDPQATIAGTFGGIGQRIDGVAQDVERVTNNAISTVDYLQNLLDNLNAQANATGGWYYYVEGEGIRTYDAEVSDPSVGAEASQVVEIRGGNIRIADSRTAQGDWDWKTVIVSGHIASELVTAANIVAGFIRSAVDPDNNYWDLDSGVARMLQLIAGKVGTSETSYAEIGTYSVVGHAVSSSRTNTYTGHGIVLHEGADTTLKLLYDKNGKQLLLGVESGSTTSYLMRIGLDYNSADPNTVYFEVNTKHNGMVTNFLASDGGLDIQSWDGTTYKGNMIPIDTPYCPVYRLRNPYNNDDHFWTVDVSEAQRMVRDGWVNEGIKFHAFK